jgi:hypothetical protein
MSAVLLLVAVLLAAVAAETTLESATTDFNIKPNGQLGHASVTFVCMSSSDDSKLTGMTAARRKEGNRLHVHVFGIWGNE